MPHPKNHLKLTGDTHLPDVGFEPVESEQLEMLVFVADDDTAQPPRVYADGWVPPEQEAMSGQPAAEPEAKTKTVVRKMKRVPGKSPWLAMGAALLLGWMAARMFRALQK